LPAVGDALTVTLRDRCSCRYGGEEFAIIMSETNLEGSVIAANRIRQELAKVDLRPGRACRESREASAGVLRAVHGPLEADAGALISAATKPCTRQAGRARPICTPRIRTHLTAA